MLLPIQARDSPAPALPILGRSEYPSSPVASFHHTTHLPLPIPRAQGTHSPHSSASFLDRYVLGEVLGQGNFGVVYACEGLHGSLAGKTFAVKLIDKVETPVKDIEAEADVHKSLHHPNIVAVHDVFFEPCFVCMVMDVYRGGDLLERLEIYWENEDSIDCAEVVHICQQMVAPIGFMHSRSLMHRDVKGENYLLDRWDFLDPDCRVLLSDFGTACHHSEASKRLREQVGTSQFWAPEVYDEGYSFKADLWALGVTTFGLYQGSMPFGSEVDVRQKDVQAAMGDSTSPAARKYISGLLDRCEASRFSAAEAEHYEWSFPASQEDMRSCASTRSSSGLRRATLPAGSVPNSARHRATTVLLPRETGANPAVRERRSELVTRMRSAAHTDWTSVPGSGCERRRSARGSKSLCRRQTVETIQHTSHRKSTFEWWERDRALRSEVSHMDRSSANCAADEGSVVEVDLISQMLHHYGICTESWGTGEAGTLTSFAQEVQRGASQLMLDATEHRKLVRVVDVVLLRVTLGGGSSTRLLLEHRQVFRDGRSVEGLDRLPGAKRECHENPRQVTDRILEKYLNCDPSMFYFDYANTEVLEEQQESRSYPGVATVYRCEVVSGFLLDMDIPPHEIGANIQFQDASGVTREFSWRPLEECRNAGVLGAVEPGALAKGAVATTSGKVGYSGLVPAPVALDEEKLRARLQDAGLDECLVDGRGIHKLTGELIKGESCLMKHATNGLTRVVEMVVLRLVKAGSGEILVETLRQPSEGLAEVVNRLPSGKRRRDENPFWCAHRIITEILQLDENCVQLDKDCVEIVEESFESKKFPGLSNVRRKRIISGVISLGQDGSGQSQDFSAYSAMRPGMLSAWRGDSLSDGSLPAAGQQSNRSNFQPLPTLPQSSSPSVNPQNSSDFGSPMPNFGIGLDAETGELMLSPNPSN